MEKSSFAMAKFGLEHKEAMPKRDCGFYLKYIFLFTSLIQFLIILGLVLFMVYGNAQAGTDTHLRLLEEKVQSHYRRIVALGAANANLSRALNATLKDKDKLQGLALKVQRELDKSAGPGVPAGEVGEVPHDRHPHQHHLQRREAAAAAAAGPDQLLQEQPGGERAAETGPAGQSHPGEGQVPAGAARRQGRGRLQPHRAAAAEARVPLAPERPGRQIPEALGAGQAIPLRRGRGRAAAEPGSRRGAFPTAAGAGCPVRLEGELRAERAAVSPQLLPRAAGAAENRAGLGEEGEGRAGGEEEAGGREGEGGEGAGGEEEGGRGAGGGAEGAAGVLHGGQGRAGAAGGGQRRPLGRLPRPGLLPGPAEEPGHAGHPGQAEPGGAPADAAADGAVHPEEPQRIKPEKKPHGKAHGKRQEPPRRCFPQHGWQTPPRGHPPSVPSVPSVPKPSPRVPSDVSPPGFWLERDNSRPRILGTTRRRCAWKSMGGGNKKETRDEEWEFQEFRNCGWAQRGGKRPGTRGQRCPCHQKSGDRDLFPGFYSRVSCGKSFSCLVASARTPGATTVSLVPCATAVSLVPCATALSLVPCATRVCLVPSAVP